MAQQGRAQPGAPVRRDRDGHLRLRPRPLPERADAGGPSRGLAPADRGARAWCGWRRCSACCCSCSARSASSPRTARSTRCGPPASTPARCSGARRWPSPPNWPSSRPCSSVPRSCSTASSSAGPGWCCSAATWLAATVGLAAVGTLYGGLAAGARGRETLLPLLLLPVVAPVLIGATRAVEAALGIAGTDIAEGWPWVGVVAVFAVAFGAGGTLAFGPLIDE